MNAIEKLKSILLSQRQKIQCTNCGSSNITTEHNLGISTGWEYPGTPIHIHNGDDTFKVKCEDCGVWIKAYKRTDTIEYSNTQRDI